MHRRYLLRAILLGAIVISSLAFAADRALAGDTVDGCLDGYPTVVGSCLTPGFDCQAECDAVWGQGARSGQCASGPQQCCSCLEF